MACTEFNDGKNDPVLARIRIGRNIWYGPGNPGARPLQGVWGDSTVYQDTCRQCAHPVPCANACPQGAIRVDPKTAPAMWMKTSASAADSARKPVRGT